MFRAAAGRAPPGRPVPVCVVLTAVLIHRPPIILLGSIYDDVVGSGRTGTAGVSGRMGRDATREERMGERNVLGGDLELCGTDPLTGYLRDGYCSADVRDPGSHTICAVVTQEFLEHQYAIGNDLITPRPEYRFTGLVPGDRWCVTAANWLRAYHDGAPALVVLACTHERALDIVPLEALRECAVDVPPDAAALSGDGPGGG